MWECEGGDEGCEGVGWRVRKGEVMERWRVCGINVTNEEASRLNVLSGWQLLI